MPIVNNQRSDKNMYMWNVRVYQIKQTLSMDDQAWSTGPYTYIGWICEVSVQGKSYSLLDQTPFQDFTHNQSSKFWEF